MIWRSLYWLLLMVLPAFPVMATEPLPAPDDRAALHGLSTGKAVFDIRIGDAKQLLFALKVIDETATGMRRQNVTPDFVLTFRGGTLPLLKRAATAKAPGEQALLTEIHQRLENFRQQKIPLEACNVAARLFKLEADELAPSLRLIGNSIISLVGYQQQGYALVPMY